ncbi:ubiquitinyl hydrolase 1 [Xylographa opegraphella]|nr:ubiquitinyl hydrolase 1 [Xylographa opegraphella]
MATSKEELATSMENPDVPGTNKRFVPLENNPEVMSSLLHQLGLSKSIGFHDVYSIDDPELLAFVPRPAYALLLVFPVNESYEKFRSKEDSGKPEYNGSGPEEEVMWFKQTIGNACGLIGLLHGASNGPVKNFIGRDSDLERLLQEATPLKPTQRADLLYESRALESAHQIAAQKGDTAAPSAEDHVELHYVCFVKSMDNNLWEMDGRRIGPIKLGNLEPEEDVLSEKALALSVRSFLKREEQAGGGELRFSLVALGQSFD